MAWPRHRQLAVFLHFEINVVMQTEKHEQNK